MDNNEKETVWVTIPEATKYLRISKSTIYELMSDGRLAFYYLKGTRQRRVKKEDLDALMILGDPQDSDD
jgi:excisionase family DNA binding protein